MAQFVNLSTQETHECIGFKAGDWMIFKCQICGDYERRMNWRTGKMITKIDENNPFQHTGMIVPSKLWSLDLHSN